MGANVKDFGHDRPGLGSVSTLLPFLAGLVWPGSAAGWSPGPYPLSRMTVEADAIVLGRVVGVKAVKKTNAFTISRATVRVTRWILGGKARVIEVFFHSGGKFQLLIPYRMAPKEQVLLFLRHRSHVRHIAPHLAMATAGAHEYALQFAKARNVGYKLGVTPAGRLTGFMEASDPKTLAAALAIVRAHLPRKPTRGLSGRLWTHDPSPRCNESVHFELGLRNTGKWTLMLYTYRHPKMVYLDFRDSRGRTVGTIGVFSRRLPNRPRPPSSMDNRMLDPGREYTLPFSVRLTRLKRPRAVRSVVARFNRTPAPASFGKGPFWVGSLATNALQIRCR